MNLIKVIQKPNGKRVISAREMYDMIGLIKGNWANWFRKNITTNRSVQENIDWWQLADPNNQSLNFEITLDFAMKLSIQINTGQGKKFTKYVIEPLLSLPTKKIDCDVTERQK